MPLLAVAASSTHQQHQQHADPQHDSSSGGAQPAGLRAIRTQQQAQQAQAQAQQAAQQPQDAESLLAAFLARLTSEGSASSPSSATAAGQQNLSAWLDEPDSAQHPERSRASFDPYRGFLGSRDATPQPSFSSGGEPANALEAKRKVRAAAGRGGRWGLPAGALVPG